MTITKILVETLTQNFTIDLPLPVSLASLADVLIIAGKHPRYVTDMGNGVIKAEF